MLDRLQPVRPVHGGGDTRVDRLDGRQQIASVDVLRAEELAPLEIVPDEVLGERPVRAVTAHHGLPHVAMRVDHPGHDDAAGGVDLGGAFGDLEADADAGDALAEHEDVAAAEDSMPVVHREHGAVAQDDRSAGQEAVSGRGTVSRSGHDPSLLPGACADATGLAEAEHR